MSEPATVTFFIHTDRYADFINGAPVVVTDIKDRSQQSGCPTVQITLPINEICINRGSVIWTGAFRR